MSTWETFKPDVETARKKYMENQLKETPAQVWTQKLFQTILAELTKQGAIGVDIADDYYEFSDSKSGKMIRIKFTEKL